MALILKEDATPFIINEQSYSVLPTKEHASNILLPLLRIADRHSKIMAVNPDVADLGDCVTAIIIYSFEMRANLQLLKMVREQDAAIKNETNATSGYNGKIFDISTTQFTTL